MTNTTKLVHEKAETETGLAVTVEPNYLEVEKQETRVMLATAAIGAGMVLMTPVANVTFDSEVLSKTWLTLRSSGGGALVFGGFAQLAFPEKEKRRVVMAAAAFGGAVGAAITTYYQNKDAELARRDALPKVQINDLGTVFQGNALAKVCAQALKPNNSVVWNGEEFKVECPAPVAR